MAEFRFRGVNDAFAGLVGKIHRNELRVQSRNSRTGVVRSIPEPVLVTYQRPVERVLFNKSRDCNPFFHLYEALWMLAGRNDVPPLSYYNSKISDIASDDDKTFHGAYGRRWRAFFGFDQLLSAAEQLREQPQSRRAVVNMWSACDDLDRWRDTKDVPCNTQAMFSVRTESGEGGSELSINWHVLDMTVVNRSNDLVWGMLGANFVHFSMLHEYMAARCDAMPGQYHHFTNNLHVYDDHFSPEEWLADDTETLYVVDDSWKTGFVPLVENSGTCNRFDAECRLFVDVFDGDTDMVGCFQEPFLQSVARPMMLAYRYHKRGDYAESSKWLMMVQARDWWKAGHAWLSKRWGNKFLMDTQERPGDRTEDVSTGTDET